MSPTNKRPAAPVRPHLQLPKHDLPPLDVDSLSFDLSDFASVSPFADMADNTQQYLSGFHEPTARNQNQHDRSPWLNPAMAGNDVPIITLELEAPNTPELHTGYGPYSPDGTAPGTPSDDSNVASGYDLSLWALQVGEWASPMHSPTVESPVPSDNDLFSPTSPFDPTSPFSPTNTYGNPAQQQNLLLAPSVSRQRSHSDPRPSDPRFYHSTDPMLAGLILTTTGNSQHRLTGENTMFNRLNAEEPVHARGNLNGSAPTHTHAPVPTHHRTESLLAVPSFTGASISVPGANIRRAQSMTDTGRPGHRHTVSMPHALVSGSDLLTPDYGSGRFSNRERSPHRGASRSPGSSRATSPYFGHSRSRSPSMGSESGFSDASSYLEGASAPPSPVMAKQIVTTDAIAEASGKRRVHEAKFECHICHQVLTTKTNLDGHVNSHLGKKEHKCQSCDKFFTRDWDRKRHEKTHSKKGELCCELCGKTASRKDQLDKHRCNKGKDRDDDHGEGPSRLL